MCGSSPRVRGTEFAFGHGDRIGRFIPAGAGNRSGLFQPRPSLPVHPRGCGEQSPVRRRALFCAGSSPRVRGTVRCGEVHSSGARFIPAGAGNRPGSYTNIVDFTVHPRGCGEQESKSWRTIYRTGSSPRVRGTVITPQRKKFRMRFIPAGAGNRNFECIYNGSGVVHPRGCGEQFIDVVNATIVTGSSPRVRGTVVVQQVFFVNVRFIPAGAGNSCFNPRLISRQPVHPRGCGEQCKAGDHNRGRDGSSPRVRGTGCTSPLSPMSLRFIPAGAGNSLS